MELLLGTRAGSAVDHLLRGRVSVDVPALFDIEICATARSRVARGELAASRARELLADLVALPIVAWPHRPLLERVWALRENVSSYDAVYVALAEALDARLITADQRLARAAAGASSVEVIGVA
jgi:predicted nucleic acid-binding protein